MMGSTPISRSKNMFEVKDKIIVSACLAGIPCNYKGEAKTNPQIVHLVATGKAIPVCPECLGGLPIPRTAAEQKEGKVITKNELDVTTEFNIGAQAVLEIAKENNCTVAILKSKSPSCGKGQIYDGTFSGNLIDGNGITTNLLIKYPAKKNKPK